MNYYVQGHMSHEAATQTQLFSCREFSSPKCSIVAEEFAFATSTAKDYDYSSLRRNREIRPFFSGSQSITALPLDFVHTKYLWLCV